MLEIEFLEQNNDNSNNKNPYRQAIIRANYFVVGFLLLFSLIIISFYPSISYGIILGLLTYLTFIGLGFIFNKFVPKFNLVIILNLYFWLKIFWFGSIFCCFLFLINPKISTLSGVELILKPVNLLAFLFAYQVSLYSYFLVTISNYLRKEIT